jgi:hypothetical protein
MSPDISRIAYCDRGYERPSGRPRVSDPATYYSSTPRIQSPAVSLWDTLLHGLATPIRETSGLLGIWLPENLTNFIKTVQKERRIQEPRVRIQDKKSLDTVGRMVPQRGFIRHQVWTQIFVGSTLLKQERSDLRF